MSLIKGKKRSDSETAEYLRVNVKKSGIEVVDVSLPAQSAQWLIDLIPPDVVTKIREEQIPLEQIQTRLKNSERLTIQSLFSLEEPDRIVHVWLE